MNMKMIKVMILSLLIGGLSLGMTQGVQAAALQLVQAKQLGFGHITMPDNISGDEFVVKALYFTLKEEADKIKGININYDGKSTLPDDLLIEAYIDRYELRFTWCEPSAGTTDKVVWQEDKKWKDSKGKEHTMTISQYESEIYNSPGQYVFSANVRGTINLLDAKTGAILVQYYGSEDNDKEIDAYTSLVKKFYKQVNKEIKESKKAYKK